MKVKITPSFHFLFVLLTVIVLYSSCRKTDELVKETPSAATTTEERFFNGHRSNDAVENALVNYIKQQNNQLHFVEKTVGQIGYPRWNKAIAIKSKSPGISGRETTGSDSSTLYYIPFVRDSQHYVNASMVIAASATDTSFWYYCDWQYRQLSNNPAIQVDEAEQMALFFMKLDGEVFGYKKFIITDTTLFDKGGNIATRVQFDSIQPGVNQLNYVLHCEDIAITVYEPCQIERMYNRAAVPRCPVTYWVYLCWYELDFGAPETGGGGGGGNGSGGGGTPPDCGGPQGRGVAARGNLPCEEEPPGWEPEPIENGPCDDMIMALKNDSSFAAKFNALTQAATNLNYEKGLYITNRTNNEYLEMQAEPGYSAITLAGATVPMDGYLHSHYTGLNAMFSPADVLLMAEVYVSGKATDSTNLYFGVAHAYGPPYLIKVTNTAKFRKFAEKIMMMERSEKEKDRFSKKYEVDFNTDNPNYNEKKFLDMLKREGAGTGLSLYRAEDNNCKKWIKLERDNFSTSGIAEINCN